jgi:transcriptional regulator with XRE-family HTH domain
MNVLRQEEFTMSVGNHIRECREGMGMTQKDLADKLFVTPQAISRWENGDVEPSVDSLKQMASIFSISVDELVQDEPVKKEDVVPVTEKQAEPKLLGICIKCGRAIYDNENYRHGSKIVTHTGRSHNHEHVTYKVGDDSQGSGLICEDCVNRMLEQKRIAKLQYESDLKKKRSTSWVWSVIAGVVGIAISIIMGVSFQKAGNQNAAITMYALTPVLGYGLFSLIFVLINNNTFVSDIFFEIVSFAFVKMPGVIFSFSPDGLAFLIIIKIIFLIITVLIFAFVVLFAAAISMLLSMFMFPVSLNNEPSLS